MLPASRFERHPRARLFVHGFSVLADKQASHANTLAMARECTALLAGEEEVRTDDVIVDESQRSAVGSR